MQPLLLRAAWRSLPRCTWEAGGRRPSRRSTARWRRPWAASTPATAFVLHAFVQRAFVQRAFVQRAFVQRAKGDVRPVQVAIQIIGGELVHGHACATGALLHSDFCAPPAPTKPRATGMRTATRYKGRRHKTSGGPSTALLRHTQHSVVRL